MSSNYQTSVDCSLCAAEMARPFALSWGGMAAKRREEGAVCVYVFFFFFLQHPSYQKITQTEFALQKPLPRQLESEQL